MESILQAIQEIVDESEGVSIVGVGKCPDRIDKTLTKKNSEEKKKKKNFLERNSDHISEIERVITLPSYLAKNLDVFNFFVCKKKHAAKLLDIYASGVVNNLFQYHFKGKIVCKNIRDKDLASLYLLKNFNNPPMMVQGVRGRFVSLITDNELKKTREVAIFLTEEDYEHLCHLRTLLMDIHCPDCQFTFPPSSDPIDIPPKKKED